MRLPVGDSQLVQIMDAALTDAARRAGEWLACRPGCTQCCHGAFAINALDAARLRAGMRTLRAADLHKAEAIEQRAKAWIAEFGPEFPGDVATGVLGTSEEEQARFEEFANDAACPALNPATGLCDVYEWRPLTCRVFGPPVRMGRGEALGCCEFALWAPVKTRLPLARCRFRMSWNRSSWRRAVTWLRRWSRLRFVPTFSGSAARCGKQVSKFPGSCENSVYVWH